MEEERLRLERLRLEGAKPLVDIPEGRLRISEEEQDLEWALDNNMLTLDEYKSILDSTGLTSKDLELM